MQIIRWEPMNDVERFFGDRPFVPLFPKLTLDLAADVYEEEDVVRVKIALPGVDPDELDIAIDEDTLTVSGSRAEESETDKKDYYSKEIRRGSFSRSVSLPRVVDAEAAKADYADGMLTVQMPIAKGQKRTAVKVPVAKK